MDEKCNDDKEMDHLNLLQKFGKYQIVQYTLICLPTIFISMNNVNYVFVAGDIDYRCRIPECDSNNLSCAWSLQGNERCPQPNLNAYTLQGNSNDIGSLSNGNFSECKEWIYVSNDTIVAWLDLACKPWKTSFVGTVHSIGMVIGMMFGGWASDIFGRKLTLIVAFLSSLIGCVKTLIPYYYGYIFIELIESFISNAAFSAGMILIVEISGNNKRVLSGVVFAYAIYIGEVMLACTAMLVEYWKNIVYIICAPSILFISYIIILKESPRWLILHNEFKNAKDILILIAKFNKINVSAEEIRGLNEDELRSICNTEHNTKNEGYIEVFKCKEMVKRLIVASIVRFSVTFIYYGLMASSVWLPGNKYTNYILTSLMSFPGDLLALYFLEKFGRRMPLIYGFLICGAACVTSIYVSEAYQWVRILLYLIGKLTVTVCYTGIWTYTMELFPTSVRGSMFGLVTLIAGAGFVLAPLTPALDTISPVFSSLFFGASALLSSILLIFTPETKGLPLQATIEEVINAMTDKKIKKINNGLENHGFDHENSINTHI